MRILWLLFYLGFLLFIFFINYSIIYIYYTLERKKDSKLTDQSLFTILPYDNMIIAKLNKKIKYLTQYSYNNIIKSMNFDDIEYSQCHSHSWHFHSSHERYVDFFDRMHRINVTRIRCYCCKKTHTILVEDMIPYSCADHELIVNIINNVDYTFSSHVSFIKKKYHDIHVLDYAFLCIFNYRNNICIFYDLTT